MQRTSAASQLRLYKQEYFDFYVSNRINNITLIKLKHFEYSTVLDKQRIGKITVVYSCKPLMEYRSELAFKTKTKLIPFAPKELCTSTHPPSNFILIVMWEMRSKQLHTATGNRTPINTAHRVKLYTHCLRLPATDCRVVLLGNRQS